MSSRKFAKGKYNIVNTGKYVGTKIPYYRSSWEWNFMNMCDTNPAIQKWASEAITIPYRDPLTNRNTIYLPDFFIQYVDKQNHIHNEVIEIKPASQHILERVGKNKYNQAQFIKNQAKWAAANAYCKQNGLVFRVINEDDIFHNGNKQRK
jgi:TnsA endonuclease N terminal